MTMYQVFQMARSGLYQSLFKHLSDRAIDIQQLVAQILASYHDGSGERCSAVVS